MSNAEKNADVWLLSRQFLFYWPYTKETVLQQMCCMDVTTKSHTNRSHRKRNYSISNIGNMMGCNHLSCVPFGPFTGELWHFEHFPTTTVRHFEFSYLILDHGTVIVVLTCCCIPNFIKIGSHVRPLDAHNCRMFNAPLVGSGRYHGNRIVADMSGHNGIWPPKLCPSRRGMAFRIFSNMAAVRHFDF